MKEKEKIKDLYMKILYHNRKYYIENKSDITDAEYDKLKHEYLSLIEKYPDTGFSTLIGHDPSLEFSKVHHMTPMMSLKNIFSKEDLIEYVDKIQRFLGSNKKIEFLCEPKIDGVSFSARFVNGKLYSCATRGNGEIGENITQNIMGISGFPDKIKAHQTIEIRGEIFIDHETFFTLEGFSNPRNAAAGSIRQLNPEVTRSRNLKYYAYSVVGLDQLKSQTAILYFLKENGFYTNPISSCSNDIDEIFKFYESFYDERSSLNYDVDGLVYKVNDIALQERLGNLSDAPRWAVAHKFPSYNGKTIIQNIFISIGRTGSATPVANLKPVNIGGVIVSKASLYNSDELKRKDIREGDLVLVERAGDVIPKVLSVDMQYRKDQQIFVFPESCPSCGTRLSKIKDEVVIRCSNHKSCPAQVVQQVKHLVSRDALKIEGIGESHIAFLLKNNFIKEASDLFKISQYREQIKVCEGWGEKLIDKIILNVEGARNTTLSKFIYAIGIRSIGEKTAQTLAKEYKNYNNWLTKMSNVDNALSELQNIDGVGNSIIECLIEFFRNQDKVDAMQRLAQELFIDEELIEGVSQDKKFVFTGTLESITRQEAKEIVKKYGGTVLTAISKNVDYLVAGKNAGSKMKKAQELGIKIINEEEFMQLK